MKISKTKLVVLTIVVVVALVVGGAVAMAANVPTTIAGRQPVNGLVAEGIANAALNAPLPVDNAVTALETAFQNIYEQVSPSVVTVEVVAQTVTPFGRQRMQQGLGSGFVWDTQGHIVTNNHVIDGATQITVVFYDGTTAPATVVAADPQSDLAVIKVNVPADQLKPVRLGNSDQVQVGQLAIAIGNPFGEQNTMTTGIISAVGRFLPTDLNAQGVTYQIPDVIQTDAPINPGNSGGVLLDMGGNVIGVTSAIESASGSNAGVGFAIPTAIVNRVVPALISTGRYDHPYLGLSGSDLTSQIATAMGLDAGQRGALVATVTPGGPAAAAGIQGSTDTTTIAGQSVPIGGDVIVAINGQTVTTFNDLVSYLETATHVGEKATLTILRNGKKMDITVTLGARPAVTSQLINQSQNSPLQGFPFGNNPDQGSPLPASPNQGQAMMTTPA